MTRRIALAAFLMALALPEPSSYAGLPNGEVVKTTEGGKTLLEVSEEGCSVRAELFSPEWAGHGALLIRRECGDFASEVRQIRTLLAYLFGTGADLSEVHSVLWGPLGASASEALAAQALRSPEWRDLDPMEGGAAVNEIVVGLIGRSRMFDSLISAFREHDLELQPSSIEHLGFSRVSDLARDGTLGGGRLSAEEQAVVVPHQGTLWFSLREVHAGD